MSRSREPTTNGPAQKRARPVRDGQKFSLCRLWPKARMCAANLSKLRLKSATAQQALSSRERPSRRPSHPPWLKFCTPKLTGFESVSHPLTQRLPSSSGDLQRTDGRGRLKQSCRSDQEAVARWNGIDLGSHHGFRSADRIASEIRIGLPEVLTRTTMTSASNSLVAPR